MTTSDFTHLYTQHKNDLEDFWGRRNPLDQVASRYLFGVPLEIRSNDANAIKAVDLSLSWYSSAEPVHNLGRFQVDIIVQKSSWNPGEPPRDLYPVNLFTGRDDWLMIQLNRWGHAYVDLTAKTAKIVLTPELAAHPDIVARGILNTVFNNLITSAGFAMLHCTGLLHEDRAILLMAPHNTGKSTTALRLVLSGIQLISDSQIYVSPRKDKLQLLGYPIARAKLRRDMVPHFPSLHDLLQPEQVRDETKFVFDLRDYDASLVREDAVEVSKIELCLLSRRDGETSRLSSTTVDAVWTAIMHNSIFFDSAAAWQSNLETIAPLVEKSRHYRLEIGRNPQSIIDTVRSLL